MIKSEEYLGAFISLGQDWQLSEEIKIALENYVCKLYGSKKSDINEARFDIFIQKHASKNKIIDLSILHPCKSSLYLHIERSNFVAKIWKSASINVVNPPNIAYHGWNEKAEIQWIDEPFPSEITELLIQDECDSEEEYGSDVESNVDSDESDID